MMNEQIFSKEQDHPGTFLPFYLPNWQLRATPPVYKLIRTFELSNAMDARNFAAKVISAAFAHGRQPNVHIYRRWVCVVWRIPMERGLSINEVVLPTAIDEIYKQWAVVRKQAA